MDPCLALDTDLPVLELQKSNLQDKSVTKKVITYGQTGLNGNIDRKRSDAEALKKRKERFGLSTINSAKSSAVNAVSTKIGEEEALKKRKERFGVDNTVILKTSDLKANSIGINNIEALKNRKERFSTVSNLAKSSLPHVIQSGNRNSLDVLQKRRERFGETTSTLLRKIEQKEKLLIRQARFNEAKSAISHIHVNNHSQSAVQPQANPSVTGEFQTVEQMLDQKIRRAIRFGD